MSKLKGDEHLEAEKNRSGGKDNHFCDSDVRLVSLLTLRSQLEDYKSQLTNLQVQIDRQREANEELQAILDKYGDDSVTESIARNDLGLVKKTDHLLRCQ